MFWCGCLTCSSSKSVATETLQLYNNSAPLKAMATARYSRSEKGKWTSGPPRPTKKPPVQIPASNNAALIEENRLTLIGRVTNPSIQKTRALVDFFLQHWHVVGTITGRDLGPNMFQFKFNTEHDLLSVLDKAPFHFKRWMLILQRWEPVVSDNFPSLIPFWIKIHGIPLHYWTDEAISAIGSSLGPVVGKEVEKGRIRVQINGLEKLEMQMEISLPSGDVKQVELEYEKLEKHCFLCYSLSHEQDDCPSNQTSRGHAPPRTGISQSRTIERIEEGRRRHDDRKQARYMPYSDNRRPAPRRDFKSSSRQSSEDRGRERLSQTPSDHSRRYEEPPHYYERDETRQIRPRSPPRHSASLHTPMGAIRSHDSRVHSDSQRSIWRQVQNPLPRGNADLSAQSQISHTPSPRPPREAILPIETRTAEGSEKGERRSALERISSPTERVPLLVNGIANSDSGRLQEVNIQYFEDTMSPHLIQSISRPSSSKNPPAVQSAPRSVAQNVSPIRSLSEDRRHVSLRLGPCLTPSSPLDSLHLVDTEILAAPTTSKAAGKRKTTKPSVAKKKPPRSPVQGVSLRKRRITKGSPKRKLNSEPPAGDSTGLNQNDDFQPPTTIIPAIARKGPGFRTAQRSLP